MMTAPAMFFAMLIGHALADYPLQGDFIGKFKSRHALSPILGVVLWPHLLTAHALIHAGAVWAITNNVWFGLAEFVLHWLIDFAKCEGWTNLHVDQALHVACKLAWAIGAAT